MKFLKRWLKTYRDNEGWINVKVPAIEYLHSQYYFDLKEFSDLAEYASSKNFGDDLKEASHALSCVVMYRNMYQLEVNKNGENDLVSVAKLFVTCRFENSTYAAMRLACMGLILDGIACLKTAFEALQYIRLISLEPDFASTFAAANKSLRPVEVRKELESLGHDVELARSRYSMLSTFSHVGGTGETLTLEAVPGNVTFKIGGYVDPKLQKRIILDCHKACGEFIAFNIGIRHENAEEYHRTIKSWIAEGLPDDEILRRTEELIKRFK
jgi:hypothetical protein